jgi:stress response protein YsnF
VKRPIDERKTKRTKSAAKSGNEISSVKRRESNPTHTDIAPNASEFDDAPTKFPVAPRSDNSVNTKVDAKAPESETATQVAFSPRPLKPSLIIIKPTALQKETSFAAKTSEILDSVKEKTTQAFETIIESAGQGKVQTELALGSEPLVIPVLAERFFTSTKNQTEEVMIEKRWTTRKEKIEVPVRSEELFVNDKEVSHYSTGVMLNEIKEKILEVVYENKKPGTKIEGEIIPLLDVNEDGGEPKETKKVIPLYAEQILVSKKLVQIGEVVISKRSVTENRDIHIDTIKEEVTIEEPNK